MEPLWDVMVSQSNGGVMTAATFVLMEEEVGANATYGCGGVKPFSHPQSLFLKISFYLQ